MIYQQKDLVENNMRAKKEPFASYERKMEFQKWQVQISDLTELNCRGGKYGISKQLGQFLLLSVNQTLQHVPEIAFN